MSIVPLLFKGHTYSQTLLHTRHVSQSKTGFPMEGQCLLPREAFASGLSGSSEEHGAPVLSTGCEPSKDSPTDSAVTFPQLFGFESLFTPSRQEEQ